ncbi:Protein CBG00019 [Caenorhabditis briggsae]|uniref:Protein CBG00019 n=1 Tax=Caenorhabditis briggsae TaxID=6238 RepID=A8WM55_CAEBR|nr:Protein CBG00019 [Caenorhabditis briggsae]CAP21559.1 Protein CBG00019 [Caenorhabditis briggsae]
MKSQQNLEKYEISLNNPKDFIAIGLRDIPYRMGPPIPGPSSGWVTLQGSFEVTRKDGVTASICVYYRYSMEFVFIMRTGLNK